MGKILLVTFSKRRRIEHVSRYVSSSAEIKINAATRVVEETKQIIDQQKSEASVNSISLTLTNNCHDKVTQKLRDRIR